MSGALRVGIAGAGWMGHVHAAAWAAEPRARVVAVADVSPDRAHALATSVRGHVSTHPSLAAMLSAGDTDVLDVCLPPAEHAEAVVDGLRSGVHVLCEKPLCLTLAEARDIARAVDAAAGRLVCAHVMLFTPSFVAARALVRDGAVG
nr:Gfo/Idh/MocA family oxidoreductase [Actinomycetota bacterium]